MSTIPTISRRDQVDPTAFQMNTAVLTAAQVAIGFALYHQVIWLVVPLILVASHFMHGSLIGFHEATHGLLRRNRTLNEVDGIFIGILSLISFSLYRAAHQTHHAYLSTERDEELWPFVKLSVPRSGRILAASLELTLSLFFTPFLFYRTFLRKGSPIRNRKLRRRIWAEILLTIAFWTAVLTTVALLGLWKYFFCIYLIPAVIAGNLQAWRKYIEHVGMTGTTVNGLTRNVVPRTHLGRFLAFSLLHEPYHGVHHQHAGLPHVALPSHAGELEPRQDDELAPFPTYWAALQDLIKKLPDPQVGPQWRSQRPSAEASEAAQLSA